MEEMKQKVEALSKMLEDGTLAYRSSDQWKEYLKFAAKMPNYSYNNIALIHMQTQGNATFCQSFSGWKSCGRYVKKGEEGIKIFCPAPYKVYSIEDKKDANGNVIRRPDGSSEKVKVCHIVPAYKVGYCFDISQTEGKPVPEICKRLDGSVEGAEKFITVLKEISPVPIEIRHVEGSANGFYSPLEKKIVVDDGLDPNHQIHTCLHEIAHATLDLNGLDKDASRQLKETEAESVSFVVMSHFLSDRISPEEIGQYSFGYINAWASTDDLTEMKDAMKTIQLTSLNLINRIENVFSQEEKAVSELSVSTEIVTERAAVRAACL